MCIFGEIQIPKVMRPIKSKSWTMMNKHRLRINATEMRFLRQRKDKNKRRQNKK